MWRALLLACMLKLSKIICSVCWNVNTATGCYWLWRFSCRKVWFHNKRTIATENYTDIVPFQPPNSYNSLSSSEQRSHQWVSKFLNGLAWESADNPYSFMHQIVQSIVFRFPLSKFYAKGTENWDFKKLLEKEKGNLEDLLCPKFEILIFYKETPVCDLHAICCPRRQLNKHCAKKKAELFYYWLTNESSIRQNISSVNTSSEFVSKFDSLQLHNVWKPFDCYFCQGGKKLIRVDKLHWGNNKSIALALK